ncbi:MAG: tetratricopeptide repeat protein [Acidobacteria bacterium]|nr:tetratricopeptide repeat protein [Acidobacteriota bacterium]
MRWTHLLIFFLFACFAPLAAQPPVNLAPDTLAFQGASPQQESPALSFEARGDIFMARKMYREAIEVYSKVAPMTSIVLNKTGIAYHQLANLDTAKKFYERSIKLNPKYAEAVNNLGTIHYAKKSYRRAISSYKKALELSPDSASMLSNLGTAYFARKDYQQAMVCYEKALSIDPEVFEHRGTTGVLLQERSVEERAKFHYYLAKTYAKAGRNDLALLYIRKSLEEGFKDRSKYLEDVEFAELRKVPEFETLMKLEPRVL